MATIYERKPCLLPRSPCRTWSSIFYFKFISAPELPCSRIYFFRIRIQLKFSDPSDRIRIHNTATRYIVTRINDRKPCFLPRSTCRTWSSILAVPVACFLTKVCVFTSSTWSSWVIPTSRIPCTHTQGRTFQKLFQNQCYEAETIEQRTGSDLLWSSGSDPWPKKIKN